MPDVVLTPRSTVWIDRGLQAGLFLFAGCAAFSISAAEIGAFTAFFFYVLRLATRGTTFRWHSLYVPVLVYFIGVSVSALVNGIDRKASIWGVLQDSYVFLLLPVFIDEAGRLGYDRFFRVFLVSTSISALYGIVQGLTGIHLFTAHGLSHGASSTFYHASGFFGLHLTYGGFMGLICITSSVRLLGPMQGRDRLLHGLASVLTLAAVIVSYSRAALAGVGFGLLFVLAVKLFSGRRATDFIVPVAFLAVLTLAVGIVPDLRQRMTHINSVQTLKKDARYYIWTTAWNAIRHHPIFGIGSQNFRKVFDEFSDPALKQKSTKSHSHNDILQSWLDGGLLGLAGYLGMMFLLIGRGVVAFFRSKDRDDWAHAQLGFSAAVTVMFFQSLGQCYFTTAIVAWVFWFLASGLFIPRPADSRGDFRRPA